MTTSATLPPRRWISALVATVVPCESRVIAARSMPWRGAELAQAGDHRLGRIGRRRGHLVQHDAVGRVVEREEVREGAADVDTDHPGHLPLTPHARGDLAGRGAADQSM